MSSKIVMILRHDEMIMEADAFDDQALYHGLDIYFESLEERKKLITVARAEGAAAATLIGATLIIAKKLAEKKEKKIDRRINTLLKRHRKISSQQAELSAEIQALQELKRKLQDETSLGSKHSHRGSTKL